MSESSYKVKSYDHVPERYQAAVYSKWLRSLRFGNDFFKMVDSGPYYEAYHRYPGVILSRPDVCFRVATLSDDDDIVLGFSVSRDHVLDYVHVHKDFRRLGIGRNLVPPGIDTITHLTRTAISIWGSKCSSWKFNPFA